MPRPTTKAGLIETSNANFNKLMQLINDLPENKRDAEFPKGTLNRNVRDVLGHLHHWNLMTLEWYKIGMKGEKPEMPANGYTWKTLPALNKAINEKYTSIELKEALKLVKKSFAKLQKTIANHSDQEIFEKKRYKWTGSTSMGSYFVSAASSHYTWAYKLIKKATK
jgi:hypothetical protein